MGSLNERSCGYHFLLVGHENIETLAQIASCELWKPAGYIILSNFQQFSRPRFFFSRVHISCKTSLLFWLLVLLLLRSSKRTSEKVQAETVRQLARWKRWGSLQDVAVHNLGFLGAINAWVCTSIMVWAACSMLIFFSCHPLGVNSTPPVPPAIAEAAT